MSNERCDYCNGGGTENCTCHGDENCRYCNGAGETNCRRCNGSGSIWVDEWVKDPLGLGR